MPKAIATTKLKGKTVSELIESGGKVKTSLDGNVNFSVDIAKITELDTKLTALDTKQTEAGMARDASEQKTAERDTAREDLENTLTELVNFVNSKSTDEAILQTSGFDVYIPSEKVPVELVQVQNLSATEGDNDGEIDLQWDRVSGATAYGMQQSLDPNNPTNWTNLEGVGKTSKTTVSGLTSGTKYWFRVRAKRGNESAGWSDPATKVAP